MIINLTNVSINYSAQLPEVRLEIPFIGLDMTANTMNVQYIHSLPMHIPIENTEEINTTYGVIDQGSISMSIPIELLTVITTMYQQYAVTRYGA